MFTFEQTDKVQTGLDVLVKKNEKAFCWCYSVDFAAEVCNALNEIGNLEDTLSLIRTHTKDEWVIAKVNEVLK